MSEFGKDDIPELSMSMAPEDFSAGVLNAANNYSDELAYGIYAGCLGEITVGQAETDVRFKRGLLFQFMGHIEQRRGDYTDALASYRQALYEIEAGEFDEMWALKLRLSEGHLLMHELDDPESAIEPYEEAVRIFEDRFTGSESEVAPDQVFHGYLNVLSHLGSAYYHADDYEQARELNKRLAALGGVSGALYGFDDCGHGEADHAYTDYENKPLFKEIQEKLTTEVSHVDTEGQIEDLQSLERLVDNADFMTEAPEEREHVLLMIYGRYGTLLPNLNERELYINRALKLAKRHRMYLPMVDLYMSLGENQAQRNRPMSEQHKSVRRAMDAAENAMDAGASAEIVRLNMISDLMAKQLEARHDYIGVEKLKRRLSVRGFDLERTAPGAARPDLN